MSASLIDFVAAPVEKVTGQDAFLHRSAFYLQGQGEPIFAWLHQSSDQDHVDHGVIICPPIGYEQLHSHRALRQLADQLASEMIPTLRFDWHGTGDSPGVDEDPHRYRTWLSNINQCVKWMRENLGCHRISLVGLRMGAALATLVTDENEIDNLILWSPVQKGRTYVREMKALALTSQAPARRSSEGCSDIEAAGFVMTSDTAADLGQIDLLKTRPACERVLIVNRSDLPDDNRLSQHWTSLGIRVEQITAGGYAEMMAEPHRSQVPHRAIHQIADWLTHVIDSDSKTLVCHDDANRLSSSLVSTVTRLSETQWSDDRIRESPLIINTHPALFGIVSEPTRVVDATLPLIVLLNAGSTHRIGPSRLNVLIARRLAAEGFRCLRMDLSGLGDSVSESADHNNPYPSTAFRDIDLTLRQVQQKFGATRIMLMGLCSGAYAAFQSAVQIPNPALVESILINPLTYFWKDGMTLDDSPTKHLRSFNYYKTVVLDPRKWVKLFSGNSKIGIGGAMTLLARRLKVLKNTPDSKTAVGFDTRRTLGLSHPQQEDLAGDLQKIVNANRKLAMFFAATDPGFGILNFHAKRKASRLRATGRLKIEFIDDADHTFTIRAARVELIEALTNYVCRRYPLLTSDEFIQVHEHS